jgi:hypothetical protein
MIAAPSSASLRQFPQKGFAASSPGPATYQREVAQNPTLRELSVVISLQAVLMTIEFSISGMIPASSPNAVNYESTSFDCHPELCSLSRQR